MTNTGTQLGKDLAGLTRIEFHVGRNEEGWWEIECRRHNRMPGRPGKWRWHWVTVRRCKGSKADAEACIKRYLAKKCEGSIAIIKWFDTE